MKRSILKNVNLSRAILRSQKPYCAKASNLPNISNFKTGIAWRSRMKLGFALVELLIATVIAALISVALFVAFDQINRYVVVVDDFTDTSLRDATLHQQIEKDLSGVFVPVAALKASKAEEEKKEVKPPAPTPGQQAQPPKPPEKPVEKPKKKQKPIDKIFYGANKENNLDTLSFISGNSLQAYWSKHTGKAKPRIVRVVYRLQKDKDAKNSYHLTRQEGTDLQFDAYKIGGTKAIREFIMIENIKSLQAEFWAEKKAKEDKEKSEDKKKKKEFTKTKEWKVDAEKKTEKESAEAKAKKEEAQLIPDIVVIKGELWDSSKQYSSPFEFKFELNSKATSPEEKPAQSMPQMPGQKQAKGPIDARDLIAKFPEHLKSMFTGDAAPMPNQPMVMNQQNPFTAMQNAQTMAHPPTMYNGQQYVLTGESN